MDDRGRRNLDARVIILEVQMKQLVADISSGALSQEKTRVDIEKRLRSVEKAVWLTTGIFIAIQVLLKYL